MLRIEAANTRDLTKQQCQDIMTLMQKGLSMRKAKRALGITVKVPMKERLKQTKLYESASKH